MKNGLNLKYVLFSENIFMVFLSINMVNVNYCKMQMN